MGEIAHIVEVVVLVITATTAIWALYRTHKSESERRHLEVATYLSRHYSDLRIWASLVIDKMSESVSLSELDPTKMKSGEYFRSRQRLRHELSSLLDRGRLFLPNTNEEEVGLWKSSAYRGLRQRALGCVNVCHSLVESLDYNDCTKNDGMRQKIVDTKRNFTSEMQSALEVRHMVSTIGNMVNLRSQ